MTVIAILFAILLILFIGFLVTPVSLYVDTDQGCYEVFQTPVFRFFAALENGIIVPRLQLAGIEVPLRPKKKTEPVNKTDKKHEKKSTFRKSASAWRFLINRSIRSFAIKRAVVDLDTDNFVLNAQLAPLFFWSSRGPVQLKTNFNGRVYFHFEARNRPARILWIFIQFLLKK